MSSRKAVFTVDEPSNTILVTYLSGSETEHGGEAFTDHFLELEGAYKYDYIFDFRLDETAISQPENRDLGEQWQAYAKGRDVGRRTAIVTNDASLKDRLSQSESAFPYRTLGVFNCTQDAMDWIKAVSNSDEDVQLI